MKYKVSGLDHKDYKKALVPDWTEFVTNEHFPKIGFERIRPNSADQYASLYPFLNRSTLQINYRVTVASIIDYWEIHMHSLGSYTTEYEAKFHADLWLVDNGYNIENPLGLDD